MLKYPGGARSAPGRTSMTEIAFTQAVESEQTDTPSETREVALVPVKRGGLSDRQLAMRRTGVGASEVGALAKLSSWTSPLEVWRRKVHGEVTEETPAMRRGRLLEPAVAQWYAEETGATLRKSGTRRHPNHPHVLATPDRIATLNGEPRVLEIKTTSWAKPDEWGPSGTDEVPPAYLLQVAQTMAVADLPRADLVVLISGADFRLYHFERNQALEEQLLEVSSRFWVDHVLARVPPPVIGLDNEWLKQRFPKDNGECLSFAQLTEEARELVLAYLSAWKGRVAAERTEDELQAQIRSLMGSASEVAGPGFRIDWKQDKERSATDWKALAAVAPELVSKFTAARPGNRPLKPYLLKGGAR